MTEKIEVKRVRIHINRQKYESPSPTTGKALYELGGIGHHDELFEEVGGDHEDILIPRNDTTISLKEDEHFYSQKDFVIIVNAQKKTVTKKVLTFNEVVELAFGQIPPNSEAVTYTVSYRNGPHSNPEGSMVEGQSVKIKDGMIFNVTKTNKS